MPAMPRRMLPLLGFALFVVCLANFRLAGSEEDNLFDGTLTPAVVQTGTDAEVTFRLQVGVLAATPQARLRVVLPEGLALLAGAMSEDLADLEPGKAVERAFRVRVTRPGEWRFMLVVEQTGIAPAVMSRCFLAFINPQPRPEPGVTRVGPDGVRYREIGVSPVASHPGWSPPAATGTPADSGTVRGAPDGGPTPP